MNFERKIFADLGAKKTQEGAGTTDLGNASDMAEGFQKSLAETAEAVDKATRAQMSPKGELGLPEHLDAKRLEHGIIDGAFDVCAEFNRILLWQIPYNKETFTDTGVIVPSDISKKRMGEEAPRGIIVSAGLEAMDVLSTNGARVGDTIMFIRQAMWRIGIGHIRGVEQHLIVLSVGDIVSNQDKVARLRDGTMEYGWDNKEGQHYLKDEHGRYEPRQAYVGADYG
jgi:hypothetical protein